MQTEFTCGILDALFIPHASNWIIYINKTPFAHIDSVGETIKIAPSSPYLIQDTLIELCVLMNNIKRQYKQLQTT